MSNPIEAKGQALQISDQDRFEEEILAKFGEIPEVFPPIDNYYNPDNDDFIYWEPQEYDPIKGYISFIGETDPEKEYYQSKYYILSEGPEEESILAHREISFDKRGDKLLPVMSVVEYRQKDLRLAYEIFYVEDLSEFKPRSASIVFSYIHLNADYFDTYSTLAAISISSKDDNLLDVSITTDEFEEIKKSGDHDATRFKIDRKNSSVAFSKGVKSFGEIFEDKNTGYVFTCDILEDERLRITKMKQEKSWELIIAPMNLKDLDEEIRRERTDGWKDVYKVFPAELNINDDSQPTLPQSPNEISD